LKNLQNKLFYWDFSAIEDINLQNFLNYLNVKVSIALDVLQEDKVSEIQNQSITNNCEDYTLDTCPLSWNCSICATGKYKLNNCKDWYTKSGSSCVVAETACNSAPDITMWSYTIKACNLWATYVYNWTEKAEVRWNYYQWWNNYWFANNLSWDWWNQVDASSYWPWNYYNNSTFRAGYSDWSSVKNDNLWWDTTNTDEARQWPCPSWYHVPTTLEWDGLVKAWFTSKWVSCTASAWSYCSWSWDASLTNFKSDLKLSVSGRRNRHDGSVLNQGSLGSYWSSSPYGTYARSLYFDSSYVYPQSNFYRAYGFSVRCFKN
jgi:hypothetical protein